MKIRTQKIGGIWHGTIEGHPEVDERGLTEEVARRKVSRVKEKLERDSEQFPVGDKKEGRRKVHD